MLVDQCGGRRRTKRERGASTRGLPGGRGEPGDFRDLRHCRQLTVAPPLTIKVVLATLVRWLKFGVPPLMVTVSLVRAVHWLVDQGARAV